MLHTKGPNIVNDNGDILTLRGTNLGGWLLQESWLSPLGAGAIDPSFFQGITASSTMTGHEAAHAIDVVNTDNLILPNMETYWQSAIAQAENAPLLTLSFDRVRTFNGIVLETGIEKVNEYIRGAHISIDADGSGSWQQVENIQIDDSKISEGIISIGFGDQTAQAVSISPSNAGENSELWSVANLSICMGDEFTVRNTLIRRFGEEAMIDLVSAFQNNWIKEIDIQNIADIGLNFVRVPVYWMDFAYSDGRLRNDALSGFAKLDWLIGLCAAKGIYVLIDFHGAPGGANGWGSSGQAGPIPTELFVGDPDQVAWNQEITLRIWSALAEHFAGNETVCAYGLLNEPILSFVADETLDNIKYQFLNEIYETVREKDSEHMVVFEEFGDWSIIENRPEREDWENYILEKHPYDMDHPLSWESQQGLADWQVSSLNDIQYIWQIPILVGEFNLYFFNDVWDSFLSGLNRQVLSWSNWTYKARGAWKDYGTGGNWGFYNNYSGAIPDILHDSAETINAIWANTGTDVAFTANLPLIHTVQARADGSQDGNYIPIVRNNWIATASSSAGGHLPSAAIDDPDNDTYWTPGGMQTAGQYITIDMQPQSFDRVSIIADSPDTYPNAYELLVSDNGTDFTHVPLDSITVGFGQKMVLIPTEPQSARYLCIRLTNNKADRIWSVKDIQVYWRSWS